MSEVFWIRTRRGVEGPVSRERVVQLVSRNQVGSLDEISFDGQTWTRIRRTDFWGGNRRTTTGSGVVPSPAFSSSGPVLRNNPPIRAESTGPQFQTSGSVSRIELPSVLGNQPWKLPTMEEEDRGKKAGSSVSHTKRNIVVASAIGCVLLAIVLGTVSKGRQPAEGDPKPTPPAGPEVSTESKPETAESPVPEEQNADTIPPPSVIPDYPGEELGAIDPGDYKPAFRPIVAYLTPSFQELRSALQTVLNAPHVSNNRLYSALTEQTRLYYFPELDVVNAYSTGYDEHRDEGWPTMLVLGGAARFARLIGAVIATENLTPRDDIARYRILFSELADCLDENGCVSIDDAWSILCDCQIPIGAFTNDAWLPEAKRISMGIMLGIMAHEVGHLALGHVHSGSKTLQRTKNQEREADSFASSVGSGEWFAEPMFWGQLYFHLALALNESGEDNDTATDHPFSRERLLNLIRSNRMLAAKCGFTEDGMRDFLEQLDK